MGAHMSISARIWLLFSQALNALCYRGMPDEALSARAWREREQPEWERRRSRIDQWLGAGHCRRVWAEQIKREDARRG